MKIKFTNVELSLPVQDEIAYARIDGEIVEEAFLIGDIILDDIDLFTKTNSLDYEDKPTIVSLYSEGDSEHHIDEISFLDLFSFPEIVYDRDLPKQKVNLKLLKHDSFVFFKVENSRDEKITNQGKIDLTSVSILIADGIVEITYSIKSEFGTVFTVPFEDIVLM